MTNGIDILLALAGVIAAFEAVLFTFRGVLLRAPQTEKLERQAREAQDELRQIAEKTRERQAELNAAQEKAEAALALLRQASRERADSQRPREVLVHKLGDPADGTLFRATLHKTLPDNPEDNQVLFWSFANFVDVWATGPAQAAAIAARHFHEKAGYVVGAFAEAQAAGGDGAAPSAPAATARQRTPEVAA